MSVYAGLRISATHRPRKTRFHHSLRWQTVAGTQALQDLHTYQGVVCGEVAVHGIVQGDETTRLDHKRAHGPASYGTPCSPAWVLAPAMGSSDLRGCVKEAWSLMVRKARWAHPMLARIMLRQELCREPTSEEVWDQIAKLKTKSISPPSLDAIAKAFGRGEEVCLPHHFAHIQATN